MKLLSVLSYAIVETVKKNLKESKSSKQEAKLGFEPGKPGFMVLALGHRNTEPLSRRAPFKAPHAQHLAHVGFSCFKVTAPGGLCQLSPRGSFKSRFPRFPLQEVWP